MKKITAVVISVLLVISLSVICLADDDGYIKNVNLAPDGTLSWDKYDGAEEYWLGVNGNFERFENGESVSSRISAPGIYKLVLEGYTEGGEFMMAEWQIVAEYDGSAFSIYAEQEVETKGETSGRETETTAEQTTAEQTEEETTAIETEAEKQPVTTEAAVGAESETMGSPSDTSGGSTDTAPVTEAEEPSNKNTTKYIIAGICAVIAVAAVIAVIVVRKRSGEK